MSKNFLWSKSQPQKISHNQNHNHKKNSHKPKLQPQKFPITKITTIKISYDQNHIPNQDFSIAKISYPQNFSISTKIFSIPTKFSHTHTYKILPCSWNKMYTFQQSFMHISWMYSSKPTQTKFSKFQCPQNPSQNSFNNMTNYQHWQNSWATNIVQVTPWTKNTTIQKCSKAKITTWSTMQCLKFQQDHTTTQWQCPNIKSSMEHENNIPPPPLLPWSPCGNVEHGSWGLEGAPLHHSIQVMDDISSHEK